MPAIRAREGMKRAVSKPLPPGYLPGRTETLRCRSIRDLYVRAQPRRTALPQHRVAIYSTRHFQDTSSNEEGHQPRTLTGNCVACSGACCASRPHMASSQWTSHSHLGASLSRTSLNRMGGSWPCQQLPQQSRAPKPHAPSPRTFRRQGDSDVHGERFAVSRGGD